MKTTQTRDEKNMDHGNNSNGERRKNMISLTTADFSINQTIKYLPQTIQTIEGKNREITKMIITITKIVGNLEYNKFFV